MNGFARLNFAVVVRRSDELVFRIKNRPADTHYNYPFRYHTNILTIFCLRRAIQDAANDAALPSSLGSFSGSWFLSLSNPSRGTYSGHATKYSCPPALLSPDSRVT